MSRGSLDDLFVVLRSPRCSVCDREVRGMPDARQQGKRWFCSPSCLLQASSSSSVSRGGRRKARGPVSVVRRIVKWTLILIGLVVVASFALVWVGTGTGTKTNNTHNLTPHVVTSAGP